MITEGKGDRLQRYITADQQNASNDYPDHYPPENPSIGFRIISYLLIMAFITPLIFIFMKLLNRTRVIGKGNIAKLKPGWVLASNHLTMIDDFLIDTIVLYPNSLRGYNFFSYHAPEETNYYKNRLLFYLLAFCFFVSLTLIKNEGLALLFILFATTFLIKLYKKELRKDISKLVFLSISFLPIILWKLLCYSKGIGDYYINTNILLNLLPRLDDLNNYKLILYFLLLNEKFLLIF